MANDPIDLASEKPVPIKIKTEVSVTLKEPVPIEILTEVSADDRWRKMILHV